MSVLEGPHHRSAIPHSSVLASESQQTGNFWSSGSPELPVPLVESPAAAEALSLSLLLAIRPEWAERREPVAEVDTTQSQGGGGRKRKMSRREAPLEEQQPKRRRDTESLEHQPQFVAPHELTASSGHSQSYPPPVEPSSEPRTMRRTSGGPTYDHIRSMETGSHYNPAPYLHPQESDWSTNYRERPVLPSISSTPAYNASPTHGNRVPTSYSMSPMSTSYAPASMSQSYYSRPDSYGLSHGGYDGQAPQQQRIGHSQPVMQQNVDTQQRQVQAQSEQDSKAKPRCWEHGCAGRQFSTFSNLLRHQRERAGTAQKSYCPRCGAEFTRKTARDGHYAHAKCKPVRRSPDPSQGSSGGQGPSHYGGSHPHGSGHPG